jgi:hypothetical protein
MLPGGPAAPAGHRPPSPLAADRRRQSWHIDSGRMLVSPASRGVDAMPFQFLSDEWVEEARVIRAEYAAVSTPIAQVIRMNLVVTEIPHGPGQIDAHLDTSGGQLDIERGHVEDPDLTVTLDYETAKAMLVEGNTQAAMSAFMAGKVRVDGDMAKLLALQGTSPLGDAAELAERIRSITA